MDSTTVEERSPKLASTNVDGFWDTNRVQYTLKRATEQEMEAKVGIMAWRHLIKAIMRAFTQDPQVLQMFKNDRERDKKSDDEVRDQQFGHSPWVAGMVYSRGIQEYPSQTAHQREAFRRVSMEWHQFLGFTGVPDITDHGRTVQCATVDVSSEAQRAQNQRWYALARTDLTLVLQEMFNDPKVTFRERQRDVLDAIMTRQSWILTVMATGVGKSLLFMLSAMLSPQDMTVVVVPLLSLGDDLQDRCATLGIRCEKWNADKQPDGAQIVLVTPKGTASDAFHIFMNR